MTSICKGTCGQMLCRKDEQWVRQVHMSGRSTKPSEADRMRLCRQEHCEYDLASTKPPCFWQAGSGMTARQLFGSADCSVAPDTVHADVGGRELYGACSLRTGFPHSQGLLVCEPQSSTLFCKSFC